MHGTGAQDPHHGGEGERRGDPQRFADRHQDLGGSAHRGAGQHLGGRDLLAIPVEAKQEKDARDLVAVGELGYWPPGSAFCIFFGRTPASTDERPRAASPVNILGKIQGDATVFKAVSSGTRVTLDKAE